MRNESESLGTTTSTSDLDMLRLDDAPSKTLPNGTNDHTLSLETVTTVMRLEETSNLQPKNVSMASYLNADTVPQGSLFNTPRETRRAESMFANYFKLSKTAPAQRLDNEMKKSEFQTENITRYRGMEMQDSSDLTQQGKIGNHL